MRLKSRSCILIIVVGFKLLLSLSPASGECPPADPWANLEEWLKPLLSYTDKTPANTPLNDPEADLDDVTEEIDIRVWAAMTQSTNRLPGSAMRKSQALAATQEAIRRFNNYHGEGLADIYYHQGLLNELVRYDELDAAISYRHSLREFPGEERVLDRLIKIEHTLIFLGLGPNFNFSEYYGFFEMETDNSIDYGWLSSPWCGYLMRDVVDPSWVLHANHGWWYFTELNGESSGAWLWSPQLHWIWIYRGPSPWMYLSEMPEAYQYALILPQPGVKRWAYFPVIDQWVLIPDTVSDPDFNENGISDWEELQ